MKKPLLLIALLLLSALLLIGPASAQEPPSVPDDPSAAARILYTVLLNAPPDQYPFFLENYLCVDYAYPIEQWTLDKTAQGDTQFTLEGVIFELIQRNRTAGWAKLAVSGVVVGNSASGAPAQAALPSEVILWLDGTWRLCPNAPLMQVISAADQSLEEASALETAQAFYLAFYSAQYPVLETLTCLPALPSILSGTNLGWSQGFEVRLPESQWSLSLIPSGPDFQIISTGQLQVFSFQRGALVAADPRLDFPEARLIRQNGWKFCTDYRPGETLVRQFAQEFFGPADANTVGRLVCRAQRQAVSAAAQEWNYNLQSLNAPASFWLDSDASDDRSQASSLNAIIGIDDQGQVISLGQVFGSSAELVKEANQWRWCQPVLPQ
jgi:hypothetical protein